MVLIDVVISVATTTPADGGAAAEPAALVAVTVQVALFPTSSGVAS